MDPANEDAWEVYALISNKPLIVGMGAYIGADISILPMIAAAYGVPRSEYRFLLDKILVINQVSCRIWQEEEKERQAADKARRDAQSRQGRRGLR